MINDIDIYVKKYKTNDNEKSITNSVDNGCRYDWTKSPELADGDVGRWHSACLPAE